jgi:hypothetical protein
VLREAGETDTTQGNIQDWLQLDESDAEKGRNCCSDIYNSFVFISITYIVIHPFVSFLSFSLLGLSFASLKRIIA